MFPRASRQAGHFCGTPHEKRTKFQPLRPLSRTASQRGIGLQSPPPDETLRTSAPLVLGIGFASPLYPASFVPDHVVKPQDVSVLMAADGDNPNNLCARINYHHRPQVKQWPVGGQTTWKVDVTEAGQYAVKVLFSHGVKTPLKVAVSSGAHSDRMASSALAMETDWLHRKRDTEIAQSRMQPEALQTLPNRFRHLQSVLMFNREIKQEGTLSAATVDLLHGLTLPPLEAAW